MLVCPTEHALWNEALLHEHMASVLLRKSKLGSKQLFLYINILINHLSKFEHKILSISSHVYYLALRHNKSVNVSKL